MIEGHGDDGFTLLEMLVVLAIAALVFSIGAISLSALNKRVTPQRVADQIVLILTEARLRATERSIAQQITVDPQTKSIKSAFERDVVLPQGFALSVTVGREIQTPGQSPKIIFLPDGTSTGGTIAIVERENRAIVEINWLTGLSRRQ